MAMSDEDRPGPGDNVEPQGFGRRVSSNDADQDAQQPASDDDRYQDVADADDIYEQDDTYEDAVEPDRDEALAGDDGERLALGDEDTRLPWLEGDDDMDEETGGSGLLLMALVAFGALALIIGGIWWFTRDRGEAELVADGSVIEAPDEPYKEKPLDPGGKTFEGTGDTSYAVSEGETRTARLGGGEDAPKPGFEAVGATAPAVKPSPTPPKTATAAAATQAAPAGIAAGPGVQVGAFSSRAAAEAGWSRIAGTHSALSGVKHRVVEGKADIGTVYRLQALPGDGAAARALCAKLKAAGQDCTVKD